MPNIRTANKRARRRHGDSVMIMDIYERDGRQVEELVLIQNGRGRRHSPKVGVPGHFRPGEDEVMDWVPPAGRE